MIIFSLSKRICLIVFTILYCLPSVVFSSEIIRVVVLPFEIYSSEDRSSLESEIKKVIGSYLKQEGAVVLEPEFLKDSSWRKKAESTDGIRNLGVQSGSDYVIWGSMTWIDQKFSLDSKLIESFTNAPPHPIYVEGKGIENLSGTVKKLAQDVALKIFKLEKIAEIIVEGNKRIEADAIKRRIKTNPGDVFLAKNLSEDLKSVYSMGYFEDIRIEAEKSPEGKIVTFRVKEKPTLRNIRIKGNVAFDDEKILEDVNIKKGSILNVKQIQSNIKRIEELYKDKNYHNINVAHDIRYLDNNLADLEFVIEEGKKVRIKSIDFEGNNTFKSKELKKVMQSDEKGFFSWLTSSGELDKADLSQDVAKLAAFYHNHGYIQARVGEPQLEFKENWIYINIKIDEGEQFKVGTVDIEGDLVRTREELLEKLKIGGETFYNREVVRNDVLLLTDLYSDEGYAYAEIIPRIDQDMDNLKVNIIYDINKGKEVNFEKIIISGNTKTRDKVIRRELKVYEQELYSGLRLKRGVRNLYRLDFFEDIKVNTLKGSSDDKMILKIDVTEKPTGAFSVGGGYSSVENLFAMATISQKNLLGRAQRLELKAELGGRSSRYTLSFTEPWFLDIPLSAGVDLYNWQTDYLTYDKDSLGGALRFSYPVFDFTRAYLSYGYDVADIKNIEEDASRSVKELEGTNVTSSLTTSLRYDSRDRVFNPTEGSDHRISIEYAGGLLGGDIGFTKYTAEAGWYIPLFKGLVGFIHGKTGYVHENSGGKLPDYERFYLGGMNSLRGFGWRDISALDEDGAKIGGDKFVQFNNEIIFPLIKKVGIVAVIFFDMGNVYNNDEDLDLGSMRESAGYGFRWYSPVGPIRIENGYILNPKEGEDRGGRWEFTMGAAF